jgi:MYXO-CTERM domain-containing protein
MRKTIAVVTLTAALTGVPAAAALADDAVAASPVVVAQEGSDEESDKTGLWGLLGLLGLAGLAKRKGKDDVDVQPRH